MAPSKTFNLAGLGCAFADGTRHPIAQDRMTRSTLISCRISISWVSKPAIEAAYEFGDEWNRRAMRLSRRQPRLPDRRKSTGFRACKLRSGGRPLTSPGSMYPRLGTRRSARHFSRPRASACPPASRIRGFTDFMRLNFACPRSRVVEQAVERAFARAIENLRLRRVFADFAASAACRNCLLIASLSFRWGYRGPIRIVLLPSNRGAGPLGRAILPNTRHSTG